MMVGLGWFCLGRSIILAKRGIEWPLSSLLLMHWTPYSKTHWTPYSKTESKNLILEIILYKQSQYIQNVEKKTPNINEKGVVKTVNSSKRVDQTPIT